MNSLLSLDDALALIARHVRPVTDTEPCALADASGRVTAAPVIAPYALPPFTNTGVDGYAFRHAGDAKKDFVLRGASFAGEPFTGTLQPCEAARIATGAVLPDGADTVAMQEDCRVENGVVSVNPLPAQGANIRHAGADIAAGTPALPAHHTLRPQDIALLGALGLRDAHVLRRLRVAVASTGHELLQLGAALKPGHIIDTNGLMLRQLLESRSIDVTMLEPLPDDYAATAAALADASLTHDLILTTGGVSVGDRDYVRDVLKDQGNLLFWKLAIRPGKPVMVGRFCGHGGDCLMAGLPGNPVSALVTFFLIVRPLLDALQGQPATLPPAYEVPLAEPIAKPAHLRTFARARLIDAEGKQKAQPFPDQSSNLFTSLTQSDGLLDLPAGRDAFAAGEPVLFRPFTGLF